MAVTLEQILASKKALPSPEVRRAIRIAAGATLQEVADECGVTRQAVLAWERGRRTPRGELRDRYVAALAVLREAAGL